MDHIYEGALRFQIHKCLFCFKRIEDVLHSTYIFVDTIGHKLDDWLKKK